MVYTYTTLRPLQISVWFRISSVQLHTNPDASLEDPGTNWMINTKYVTNMPSNCKEKKRKL
jgi:hypothetical protein